MNSAKPHQCNVGAHDWEWITTNHSRGEGERIEHYACKRAGCTLQKTVKTVTTYHGAVPELPVPELPVEMTVERGTAEEGDRGYGR